MLEGAGGGGAFAGVQGAGFGGVLAAGPFGGGMVCVLCVLAVPPLGVAVSDGGVAVDGAGVAVVAGGVALSTGQGTVFGAAEGAP